MLGVFRVSEYPCRISLILSCGVILPMIGSGGLETVRVVGRAVPIIIVVNVRETVRPMFARETSAVVV